MLRNERKVVQETHPSSAIQEEISVQMSKSHTYQELPRERKRWIRPPLIGQASASEHSVSGQSSETNKSAITQIVTDSSYRSLPEYSNSWSGVQAFAFQHHLHSQTSFTPLSSQSLSFATRATTDNSSASTHIMGQQRHGTLRVTEDACCTVHSESKITKEKSDVSRITCLEDSGATKEEVSATIPESPNARAPSPASVSSVTSSRRLEWDSGADVGYLAYQIADEISISGHDMSTIERIALAQGCSAALSMRLDPEGTICSGQQSNTLLLSNQMKTHKSNYQIEHSKTLKATDSTRMQYITDSGTKSAESESEVNPTLLKSNGSKSDHADSTMEKQKVSSDKNREFVVALKEQQHENGMQVKKLSSSLSSLNELESQNHKDLSTLHRSQSQNSVSREYIDKKTGPSSYLSFPQYNSIVVTNSLSSSSLATVVSKRDYRITSNKRTQTSPHASVKQSIAIQVCDDKHATEPDFPEKSEDIFQNKHSDFEHTEFVDTSDVILEKTRDTEKSVASGFGRTKHDSAKKVVSEQLKTAFQKQALLGAFQETINSPEIQNSTVSEAFVMHKESSNVKTSQGNNVSSNHVLSTNQDVQNVSPNADNLQAESSWFLSDETLIGKTRYNDTSRRGSIDAIDSAQSFEYLPGHVFENMTKITLNKDVIKEACPSVVLHKEILDDTSSESLASKTLANDLDKVITLVTSYLSDRPHSSSEKKRLIRKIVKRLLETKYTDDTSSRESHVPTEPGTQITSHDSRVTVSVNGSDSSHKKPQKSIQHSDSKLHVHVRQSPAHLSDKCIGTAFSDESALPYSTSQSPALEIQVSSSTESTVYATGPISTTTSTSGKSNFISWKRHSAQLEREYELCKQNQKQSESQSVLLNFCKTERENQLSWICTEIHHLKRLKQLLENQEKLLEEMEKKTKLRGVKNKYVKSLYSSPTDTRSTETSDTKSKRFLESYSTASTDQETSSTGKSNAIFSNIHRSREMYKVFDFNTAKAHRKYNREGKYLQIKSNELENVCEIQDKVSVCEEKPIEKPNLCKQKYIEKLREDVNTKISKDEGVQTSLRSSSSSFRTYVMSEKSENHTSSGRVNVHIQTKDKTSSSNGLKDYKTSAGSETHKFNSSEMPLCCCECKKLCEEVKRKLTERSKAYIVKHSKCRCSQAVPRESSDDKLSSYGTLNDAAELTKDSECHAEISSLRETRVLKKAENAGVQTTLSFKEEFLGRCGKMNQTYSEKHDKETSCLCHRLIKSKPSRELESQAQNLHLGQKSAVKQESLKDEEKLSSGSDQKSNDQKAIKLKTKGGHTSKKCTICSASISESSRSKHKVNQSCSNCQQKTLSSSSTSIMSSSELPNNEPIAYILTLESASEISIPEKTQRKQLEEIVMKVPIKKKSQTDVTKNKKQAKQKTDLSKENHRPKHKMYSNNSGNNETTKGIGSLTLQEYLMLNRPDFIESAEERRSCLDELVRMRELHQKSKRERLVMATHVNFTSMKDIKDLSRPPLAVKRVFSQRTMRAQTEQKYRKLPEMQVKKVERKKKEEFRTNRLMAQIFAKKLQEKALRGEVSLSNSKSVISTI